MNTELEKTDIVVDEKPIMKKQFGSKTGYPDGLTVEQVVRLIYFFGARKLQVKANVKAGNKQGQSTKPADFTSMERIFLDDCFKWYGIVCYNPTQYAAGYRAVILRFKRVIDFLRERPAFITPAIYNALKTAGYTSVTKPVVLVMNENRETVVRLNSGKEGAKAIPLAKIETMSWEFQNILSDKLLLIIQSITPADIKKANLGIKSKALRDLYSVMHMAKIGNKNPNQTLIGINIQTSSPGEKLRAVTNYAVKNREQK